MTASIRTPTAALERPAVRVADGDPEAGDGYLAKRALVNELGAEKAKKRLRAAEAKRVRADAVHDQAGLAGDVTALDAAAALAPPKPSEQERKALHPRFNLGATTVADAFPRAGIVPDFIWDRLDVKELPTAAALGASNVLEVAAAAEGWPPFVLEQLRADLPGATDAAERKRRQRGLLFLSHMAAFLALRRDDRDAIVPAEAPAESDNARGAVAHCKWIPVAVWGQLYATFTEKTSRGAPAAAAAGDGEGSAPLPRRWRPNSTTTSSRSRCSSPAARSLPTSSPARRPPSASRSRRCSSTPPPAARWRRARRTLTTGSDDRDAEAAARLPEGEPRGAGGEAVENFRADKIRHREPGAPRRGEQVGEDNEKRRRNSGACLQAGGARPLLYPSQIPPSNNVRHALARRPP